MTLPTNTIPSWPSPKRSASTLNPPSTPLSRSARKWRPPNFGTRRAITIDFTSGIIILDVQFSVPGRPVGGSSSYFSTPLLPNGGRCMSKKQFLLTQLALITLIVNLEVSANSLERFANPYRGRHADLPRWFPVRPIRGRHAGLPLPYTQLRTTLIGAQPEERLPLKPCKLPAVKEAVL